MKPVQWDPSCSMRMDGRADGRMEGQTDMTKKIVCSQNKEHINRG